jgi:hypothetical protein
MRRKRVLTYQLTDHPETSHWTLSGFRIPRPEADRFVRSLHDLALEKNGAAHYFTTKDNAHTDCRYEFSVRVGSNPHGARVLLQIRVGDADVTQALLHAFLHSAEGTLTALTSGNKRLLARVQTSGIQFLIDATLRFVTPPTLHDSVVFYLKFAGREALCRPVELLGGGAVVLPTRFTPKDLHRLSPVLVRVHASSRQDAKSRALREISRITALFTTALSTEVKTELVRFEGRRRVPEAVEEPLTDLESLYSKRWIAPSGEWDDTPLRQRLEGIVHLFGSLPPERAETAENAMFAFSAAVQFLHKHPTVAIVALIAALGALTKGMRESCSGEVGCSACGKLHNFRHDLVGERVSIVKLVADFYQLEPQSKNRRAMEKLIARMYSEQRSSYVHGAKLHHGEYHKGFDYLTIMPSSKRAVSALYQAQCDLFTMLMVVRSVIIRWMVRAASAEAEAGILAKLGADEEFYTVGMLVQASVRAPANTIVRTPRPRSG